MSTRTTIHTNHERLGIACPGCQFDLPLREARSPETSAVWECTNCRAPFAGAIVARELRLAAQRVRLADDNFQSTLPAPSLTDVKELVRQIAKANSASKADGRSWSLRVPEHLEAVAVSLDAEYQVTGEKCVGIVADLSARGLCLLTDSTIEAPAVIVQLRSLDGSIQLLGRVTSLTPLPRNCCGVNVEFVARLGNGPDV